MHFANDSLQNCVDLEFLFLLSEIVRYSSNSNLFNYLLKGLFTLTTIMTMVRATEEMGYIVPHGSVHMETCRKGNGNP